MLVLRSHAAFKNAKNVTFLKADLASLGVKNYSSFAIVRRYVPQARASDDYQPRSGDPQWKIGVSSLFADAVGIAPFKDTFWTTSDQPGNFYKGALWCGAVLGAVSAVMPGKQVFVHITRPNRKL